MSAGVLGAGIIPMAQRADRHLDQHVDMPGAGAGSRLCAGSSTGAVWDQDVDMPGAAPGPSGTKTWTCRERAQA